LANEDGADNVRKIIQDAISGDVTVKMNQINLLEVYYDVCRTYGRNSGNKVLATIKKFPIEIITGLTDDVFKEAGRLKATYKIPLGDTIALAECIIGYGTLVTSDHNDFEPIARTENVNIYWFR
jgi:predicted nucleic acid-binding protein